MAGNHERPFADNGEQLTLVATIDGVPYSDQVTVCETEPFVVEAPADWCRLLRRTWKAILLRPHAGGFTRAEVEVVSLSKFRNTHRIGLTTPQWEASDRRRYPRFPLQTSVALRSVSESSEGVQIETVVAVTEDLSVGSAWVKTNQILPAGTVVQVEVSITGHICRMLGFVVRDEPERMGFAVEFLDFVGSSRYLLNEFLQNAA